jgi:hypothetical protein
MAAIAHCIPGRFDLAERRLRKGGTVAPIGKPHQCAALIAEALCPFDWHAVAGPFL